MTVSELITELQNYDPDLEVWLDVSTQLEAEMISSAGDNLFLS